MPNFMPFASIAKLAWYCAGCSPLRTCAKLTHESSHYPGWIIQHHKQWISPSRNVYSHLLLLYFLSLINGVLYSVFGLNIMPLMDNIILSEWGKKKKSCMEMGLKITNKWKTMKHEDPHTTFFCTPHGAGVVKDAKFWVTSNKRPTAKSN